VRYILPDLLSDRVVDEPTQARIGPRERGNGGMLDA